MIAPLPGGQAAAGDVTLVYAARDTVHNSDAVLKEFREVVFQEA